MSDLHAKKVQQAVVLVDLTSRGFLVGEITNNLQKLSADATFAHRLLLGVAAKVDVSIPCEM
jgi:hypothetical protein